MKKLIVLILFIGILGAGAYYRVMQLRNQPDTQSVDELQAEAGMPVQVYVCHPRSIDDTISASGTIEPLRSAVVAAETAGRVEQIHVKTGQKVHRGDILISLDARTAQLAVEQAQTALEQARETLAKLRNGSRPEEIELARAQMEQARADLNLKNLEKERFAKLYDQEAATLQMKQQAEAAYHAARAAFDAMAASYQLVKNGPRSEDIKLAEIGVSQAQTALAQAKDRESDFYLRAPFDGIITAKLIEVGDVADFKQGLFRIIQIDRVYTDVEISELEIDKISTGMKVHVELDALPNASYAGIVTEINPISTNLNRSYRTRIELDNADGRLRQGMFARARLITRHLDNVFLVPEDAVKKSDEGDYVLTINSDNIAEKTRVEAGKMIGDQIIIQSGVSDGLRLIVMGLNIEPGQPVTIME